MFTLLDILLRIDEKFGSNRSQRCMSFANYWRQLRGQYISRRYTVLLFFHQKKLVKKTPKIKEVYTVAHAGCRHWWVPEGTKSQICIRILYFLHEFWAMTPAPRRSTRFPVSNRQHPHVKDHTGLGGPNSLKFKKKIHPPTL